MLSFLDPRVWIAIAVASAIGYGSGRYQQWRASERSHAADMAVAAEKAREVERNAEKINQRITDALSEANRRASANSRLAADRLRALSAARSEAAAACSRLDAPAATVVPGVVRENLINDAVRANEVARQLTALQDYVSQVCRPEGLEESR